MNPRRQRRARALSFLFSGALCVLSPLEAAPDARAAEARSTPDWIKHAVVYEIFPRQFSAGGNLAGVTDRLDELKALGIDVLWLMPIHPVGRLKAKGTVGSPYAIQDYYAINPDYGTKEDFRKIIGAAHTRGLKVIIDIVANHTAWDSVMMSHPAYYKQDADGHVIPPHPDWADVAGLNYANPETRLYMRKMMRYWVEEFGLDGLRCDAAGEVPTDFWDSVRDDLDRVHPGLLLLAEAEKPELLVHAFDVDYAWPLMTTLNKVFMDGAPAGDLARTWAEKEVQAYPKGALHLLCSDNHDEARAVSRYGWKGALAASALLFSLDGVPLLYNGMEVGDATESGDPALFEKVPVFWHPKQRDAFRETYRRLIELRHRHSALTEGSMAWLPNSNPQNVVSLIRGDGKETLITLVNVSNRPQQVSLLAALPGSLSELLGSEDGGGPPPRVLGDMTLGAFGWVIFGPPTP
jgi:cyclomaltodextrinase